MNQVTELTGKVVTLPKGVIVTVEEEVSPWSHKVISDQGQEMEVLTRVLRELPPIFRRNEL